MKRWGILIVVLYGVILTVLFLPLSGLFIFFPNPDMMGKAWSSWLELMRTQAWWVCLAVALIAQAALLTVPVEMAAKRPVTKRSLMPLVITASLMMAFLVAGVALSIDEVFKAGVCSINYKNLWPLIIFLLVWLFWAGIFFSLKNKKDAQGFIDHVCGWLLRGSILELLVAVPAHIYVRQRNECCAGIQTFMGIGFGLAVMLFSFGPGVYFLFVKRCQKLKGPNI